MRTTAESHLDHTTALLARTPAALNVLLRDLPEIWTQQNEGKNTWSAFGIVGHLIHAEHADWIPRVKLLLQFGETRAFEPFDRSGYQRAVDGKTLPQLLDDFSGLRADNLRALGALNLQPHDLDRRGLHPVFGSVTLSALLATWAAHDLTHLHQLSRVMAHQPCIVYSTTTTVISARSVGRSRLFFGKLTILSATSIPFTTSPKTVYCPSRKFESLTTMKN